MKRTLARQKSYCVTGPRLHLRPIRHEDIQRGYLQWVNDPAVNSQLAIQGTYASDSLMSYMDERHADPSCIFFVTLRGGRLIGTAKIQIINWETQTCRYGRMIGDRSAQGKRLGTELTYLLVRFSFDRLHCKKVTCGCYEINQPAIKSNEKAGMHRTGRIRGVENKFGRLLNYIEFAVTPEEFDMNHQNFEPVTFSKLDE